MNPIRFACVLVAILVVSCSTLLAQPGVPEWLKDIDAAKFALLKQDLKAGMTVLGEIDAGAEAHGFKVTDAQGNVTEQQGHFFYLLENIDVEIAGDENGWVTLWVGVTGTHDEAVALTREHFNYGMNPDWMVNGNDLGDARIPPHGGSVAGTGRAIICYRNMVANFSWNGREDEFSKRKIREVALLWLNKVAGAERANLCVRSQLAWFRWWMPDPNVEREPVCDQQYVMAQVYNWTDKVTAVGAEARLLLAREGDAEFQPIGGPVRLPDIPPWDQRPATFYWDLDGKNIENAWLRVAVSIPNVEDADPADNQVDMKCSIYYANNGKTPFRWVEDSYSFGNYGYKGREGQEMVEGVLATVIGQVYTDPQAATLLSRLIFPQTYTQLMKYLDSSMASGAGGHCYGMAATAGLYFMDASLRPGGGRTCDISQDTASANINIYQRAQMVPIVQAVLSGERYFERNWGGLHCLNTARTILKNQRRPVILSITGTRQVQEQVMVNGQPQMQQVNKRWGHAVLAYKLVERVGQPSALYVYDPNIPPRGEWNGQNPSSAFSIDTTTGDVEMDSNMEARYVGFSRLAAREVTREVSLAEVNALIPTLKAKLAEMMAWFEKADKIMALLRCPSDALFTDAQGRRTGVVAGKVVNEIPGAEVRSEGEVEIYILPANAQISVQITGTGNGKTGFDIIRSKGNGVPELISFDGMGTKPGSVIAGTIGAGGSLATLADAAAGKSYSPALTGSLEGDRVSWQNGSTGPTTTPGPTVTPQPVTPQPVTPQPVTPQPGVGSAPAWGAGRVGTEMDAGKLMGEADTFTGVSKLVAIFPYKEVPAGTTAVFSWLRDGHQFQQQEYQVKATTGQVWFWISTKRKGGYEPGAYEVRINVGGKVVASRAFRIGAGGTPQPGTPVADGAGRDHCLSNLKNLGLGARLYSADHDNKLPDADKWVDQVRPYLNKDTFFKCASAPDLEYGYAMNAVLSGMKIAQLQSAAEMVLFFDSHLGTKNAAGGREAVCNPGRHGGGNCYVYADGRAKWLAEIPGLNPAGLTPQPTAPQPTAPQPTAPQPPADNALTEGDVLKALTGNAWTRQDPGGDGEWTDDEAPKAITIGAPPGNHLHRDYNYDAPRQMLKVNGDFTMQALVKTNPQWETQAAGLWVFGPKRSLVRLERVCAADRQLVALAAYDTAGQRLGLHTADCTAKELRLSIRRTGDDFHGWYRLTGADDWTLIGKVSVPMPVRSRAGLGVINDPGSEWFEARFSAFQIKVVGAAVGPAVEVKRQPIPATRYEFVTKWGGYGTAEGYLGAPHLVALDADGNVYVADSGNRRIQKFTSDGTFITKWGGRGAGDGEFYDPVGVAVGADGNVYVADTYNHRIQKFTSSGRFITKWGSKGSGDGQFGEPQGVAVDADGNVYVADRHNCRVQKFTGTGKFITKWGSKGGGDGQFGFPTGVAVDADGNVYVADAAAQRIQKFTSTGGFITKWGSLRPGDARFWGAWGVAVDAWGNVYVVDRQNDRIQKFTGDGTFITKWGSRFGADGDFYSPVGVAVDADGNVYVVDAYYHNLQKFRPVGP